MDRSWYAVTDVDEIPSPALLLYPERVEENISRMIQLAGGARLRPHMKTNKLPEVVRMHLDKGITKFKCATIAEAEMIARCGAPDVLLAYQPVGPNVNRFLELLRTFPATSFSALADDERPLRTMSAAAERAGVTVSLFLDIDCGMHRTGVPPGNRAVALYRSIAALPGLKPAGLHAYDGHLRQSDPTARAAACDAGFASVHALQTELLASGLPVPAVVAGGTPTFRIHARRAGIECSPGTSVFWDVGYSTSLPDLDFLPAVLLLTRVISKPGEKLLCLDLGHKAVASEMPHPRVELLGLDGARAIGHSEEHLVVETDRAAQFQVGSYFYGIPWHVCPTVALHDEAVVVRNGRACERWHIVGRARRITI